MYPTQPIQPQAILGKIVFWSLYVWYELLVYLVNHMQIPCWEICSKVQDYREASVRKITCVCYLRPCFLSFLRSLLSEKKKSLFLIDIWRDVIISQIINEPCFDEHPRRHHLADGPLSSLYAPSPSLSSFGAASLMMCCSARPASSSAPSVLPEDLIGRNIINIRCCDHIKVLNIFDRLTSFWS